MSEKNINIGNSLMKFTFTDESGDVVAYFRMNPADFRVAERAGEIAAYFKENTNETSGSTVSEAMSYYEKILTEKINYLLGYDASKTLFSFMSATAVMADGRFFASVVMDTIAQNLSDGIKQRFGKFKSVSKYTAKYE